MKEGTAEVPVSLPALETRPMCPRHLERAAVRTCSRCGQFVCGGCISDGETCSACRSQLLLALPTSEGRATWARRWLWVSVAGEAVSIAAALAALSTGPSGALVAAELAGLGGALVLVGLIGGAITFLRWVHLCFRQAHALGVATHIKPSSAIWAWFIPFVNLARPYAYLRDLIVGLSGPGAERRARMSAWWTFWVVSNVLSNVDARLSLTDPSVTSAVSLLSSGASIAAAVLALGVVRAIQAGVDERRAASAVVS